jgi:hypothetical protein
MSREPEEPETDPELEQTIYDLVKVLRTAPEDSAAYRFAERSLAGLVPSCEMAHSSWKTWECL